MFKDLHASKDLPEVASVESTQTYTPLLYPIYPSRISLFGICIGFRSSLTITIL